MRWFVCALLLAALPSVSLANPVVSITSPVDGDTLTTSTVSGTVTGGAGLAVTVNGVPADTVAMTFTAKNVPLTLGANTLTATATDVDGTTQASVMVTANLFITSPLDGATATSTGVTGSVQGGDNLTVSVNGVVAQLTSNNTGFQLANIPFTVGQNVLTATATDDTNGTRTFSVTVNAPLVVNFTNPASVFLLNTDFAGVQAQGVVAGGVPPYTFSLRNGPFNTISTALDPNTYTFDAFVPATEGSNTILAGAQDSTPPASGGPLSFQTQFELNRTIVCTDNVPADDFPPVNNSDPNSPQSYTVDRADDLPDPIPDDGICDVRPDWRPAPAMGQPPLFDPPGLTHCTLRAAIQTANAHHAAHPQMVGGDRILLGARTVQLRRTGPHEGAAVTGDLDVTSDLRIIGAGRDISIIDGNGLGDRIFDVAPGVTLQMLDLTVRNGRTPKAGTGKDPNDPNAPAELEQGGCIRNQGTLYVNDVALFSCKADADGGVLAQIGGSATMTCAIVARGSSKTSGGGISGTGDATLELRNSTLSLNTAATRGGAISQQGTAFTLTNGTVVENSAKQAGGALDLGEHTTTAINNCTFSLNKAKAGSTFAGGGDITISNSILGDSGKSSCDPNAPEILTSGGGNVERDTSCLGSAMDMHDLVNTDPKLAKLASNGSTAPTQKLLQSSPAIDFAGVQTACTDLDARDTTRFDWPNLGDPNAVQAPPFCDAGSFELTAPSPAP